MRVFGVVPYAPPDIKKGNLIARYPFFVYMAICYYDNRLFYNNTTAAEHIDAALWLMGVDPSSAEVIELAV